MGENYDGDEVYEDRYIVGFKFIALVVIVTLIFPMIIAVAVINSYGDEIDEDFKSEVILQKIWLGNDCPIDLDDASEILQYKHFACETMVVGILGVWLGQIFEWLALSNKGIINQSPWIWYETNWQKFFLRVLLAFVWFFVHMIPTYVFDASSFKMSNGGTSFVMGTLVCFIIPSLLVTFNTFAFLRLACFKLKLDNPQSVGKEFIPRSLLIE